MTSVGAPFFSVIVPVYNKGPHIARTLNSILSQSFTDFELLIVCDPSTDNSNEEVAKFTDPRIRIFYRTVPGPGGYAARNLGIEEAKAEWTAFLDADDEWSTKHLAKYYELAQMYPEAAVLGCGTKIIEPDVNSQAVLDGFYNKNNRNNHMLLSFEEYLKAEVAGLRPLNGSTACIKKDTLVDVGMFPAGKANRGGDVDTWLRCIEKAGGLAWSNHIGATYYRDSVNMVTKENVFLAEVERDTVLSLLPKHPKNVQVLLKKFANSRTISAWKQNSTQQIGNNFSLFNKLYWSVNTKKVLLWMMISIMPKNTLSFLLKLRADLRKQLIKAKQSRLGTLIKYSRYSIYKTIDKISNSETTLSLTPKYLSDNGKATFFGYHDKSPFSIDGTKILAMSVVADDRKAKSECTEIKLGYFEKNTQGEFNSNSVFVEIAQTKTWCWQQGCMLQWHPTKENYVIFNNLVDGQYGSVVQNIYDTENKQTFNYPIYSVSSNGQWAVTLNFSRLGRLRPGYGYPLLADVTKKLTAPSDDGIFLLDLETRARVLLVSLAELSEDKNIPNVQHYVNHAVFSPDNKTLLFFHLWAAEGDKNRGLRTCAVNIETKEWWVVEEERVISHFCWRDESHLFATTKMQNKDWKYSLYDISNKTRKDYKLPLNEDSHPMFHPINKNLLVVDTYPDKARYQKLCLVNIETGEVKQMAKLHSGFSYQGQVRCDLHSRWDREGKYVIVDTTAKKRRKLAVIEVDNAAF